MARPYNVGPRATDGVYINKKMRRMYAKMGEGAAKYAIGQAAIGNKHIAAENAAMAEKWFRLAGGNMVHLAVGSF